MLGVFPRVDCGQSVIKLGPGDLMLLYTDGLIERRGIDLLDVEVTELGPDPLPKMHVRIPAAILHAGRRQVPSMSVGEEQLPRARKQC